MNSYTLELKEVDDFVPEIAAAFNVSYDVQFGEFSLKIPKDIGEGTIKGINFPNGIGLHILNCNFKSNTEFYFKNTRINSLRFIYCMKGEVSHKFSNLEDSVTTIKRSEHLIAAPRYDEDQMYQIKKEQTSIICYLEIDKERFQSQLSYNLSKIDPVYYPLFADVNALKRILQKGYYSLQISDIIDDILTNDDVGLIRTNYLGAKALECTSLMLKLYKEDSSKDAGKNTLRLFDLENIAMAVEYIEKNISNLETIPKIAQAVGMESHRLQEGFKRNYGITVNDYIKEYRLKKALTMLTTEDMNVSEVVYALGLSSRSYFSKIFKEKYGISPSWLRRNPEV